MYSLLCFYRLFAYAQSLFFQELWQALKQLQPRLVSLSLGLRRVSDGGQVEKEVAELQHTLTQHTQGAATKQAMLEDLLTLWQK